VPDRFDSLEEYQRYVHADLSAMNAFELFCEQRRVDFYLAFGNDCDGQWLLERRAKVLSEKRRRNDGQL
jgi:hypothetical protein